MRTLPGTFATTTGSHSQTPKSNKAHGQATRRGRGKSGIPPKCSHFDPPLAAPCVSTHHHGEALCSDLVRSTTGTRDVASGLPQLRRIEPCWPSLGKRGAFCRHSFCRMPLTPAQKPLARCCLTGGSMPVIRAVGKSGANPEGRPSLALTQHS
jgi:hypothetical protein